MFSDGDFQLELGGQRFEFIGPASDQVITGALTSGSAGFEPHLQILMQREIPSDGVCIDAGANLGIHASLMGLIAHNGQVIAFEPNPEIIPFLKENLARVCPTNSTVVEMGLGERQQSVSFVASKAHPAGSFVGDEALADPDETPYTIPVVPLDDFMSRHRHRRIDFIKVDIEGSELKFLDGAKETLHRHKPAMVMECNPVTLLRFADSDHRELWRRLRDLYGSVGEVRADGGVDPIWSPRYLEWRLRCKGIVDLAVGIPFTRARKRRLRDLRRWAKEEVLRLLGHAPSQRFLWGAEASLQIIDVDATEATVVVRPDRNVSLDTSEEPTGVAVVAKWNEGGWSSPISIPPCPGGRSTFFKVALPETQAADRQSLTISLVQRRGVRFEQIPNSRGFDRHEFSGHRQ